MLERASAIVWPRRYDVELFQKIEALTGKKMELFQAEQVNGLSIATARHAALLQKENPLTAAQP